MNKSGKLILNSLRCPVCKSQIDIIDCSIFSKKKISKSGAKFNSPYNYGCVSNAEHYAILLVDWEDPVRIVFEAVVLYDKLYRYKINQINSSPGANTDIIVNEVDIENRILDEVKEKVFTYDKCLFDFSKTSRDKMINRIKTILVFQ